MILKIETKSGYELWDNIEHIDVKRGCVFVRENFDYEGDHKRLLEYQYDENQLMGHCDYVIFKDDKLKNTNFDLISIYRDNFEIATIAFDTRAYLTNDQGKTIERF